MRGYVTTRHLLIHAPIILAEFGWRAYLRCLVNCLTSRQSTFLGCVCAAPPRRAKPKHMQAIPS